MVHSIDDNGYEQTIERCGGRWGNSLDPSMEISQTFFPVFGILIPRWKLKAQWPLILAINNDQCIYSSLVALFNMHFWPTYSSTTTAHSWPTPPPLALHLWMGSAAAAAASGGYTIVCGWEQVPRWPSTSIPPLPWWYSNNNWVSLVVMPPRHYAPFPSLGLVGGSPLRTDDDNGRISCAAMKGAGQGRAVRNGLQINHSSVTCRSLTRPPSECCRIISICTAWVTLWSVYLRSYWFLGLLRFIAWYRYVRIIDCARPPPDSCSNSKRSWRLMVWCLIAVNKCKCGEFLE